MNAEASAALRRLKALYRRPLYVRLFAQIRLGHAGYDVVEAALPREGRILDLGCGYGLFANFLALMSSRREVLGLELSRRKLRYADKGLPGVRFAAEDVTRSSENASWDGIALLHVLHHLRSFEEQEALLSACARRLSPGGRLVVLEVQKRPLWKYGLAQLVDHALYPGDSIFFRDRPAMETLLQSLGLRVETTPMDAGRPFPHVLYVATKSN